MSLRSIRYWKKVISGNILKYTRYWKFCWIFMIILLQLPSLSLYLKGITAKNSSYELYEYLKDIWEFQRKMGNSYANYSLMRPQSFFLCLQGSAIIILMWVVWIYERYFRIQVYTYLKPENGKFLCKLFFLCLQGSASGNSGSDINSLLARNGVGVNLPKKGLGREKEIQKNIKHNKDFADIWQSWAGREKYIKHN